ncbi:MAG: 50S ribosomal protein L18 [Euryarchaeota archaeon]|nr:50S ribosomal protein L18 [Euryarchaeota archaeon]
MAYGKSQRLRPKRRRQGKTDYHRRLRLLRSGAPRAVVRVSNTQVICQLVSYNPSGDVILQSVNGKSLTDSYSWPEDASKKSIPACYVAGYALGKKAISAGNHEAVLDIGLAASSPGSRVFSALKGMVDAGLEIPHGSSVLPSEDRLSGKHIDDSLSSSVEASIEAIEGAHK